MNIKRNLVDQTKIGDRLTLVLFKVKIHLKILIPVGMAMIIVVVMKYVWVSMSIPIVNMWCAHTMKPIIPIEIIA